MIPQSHDAAAATTTSEGMSAASRPLDDDPNIDAVPAEEKPSEEKAAEKTNTAALARLEELPSELTTIIADYLDTKSLNRLRLCCKKIAAALAYAFERRVPTFLTFFFMQTSMERLALLAKNDRWNKHFEALEMLSSTPETSRYPEKGPPCWTINSRRHLRSYRLHGISTHSYRAARAAPPFLGPPLFGSGTMPNVHTLTLCLNGNNHNQDITQHAHLPSLYAALPNLTTLHLTHVKTHPTWKTRRTIALADYVPRAGTCRRLRRLYIKHSEIKAMEELLAVMRAHAATLETVRISESSVDSLKELRRFVTGAAAGDEEEGRPPLPLPLPPLQEVLLENVNYLFPLARVASWRWDRERGVVSPDEARNEEIRARMEAWTFV